MHSSKAGVEIVQSLSRFHKPSPDRPNRCPSKIKFYSLFHLLPSSTSTPLTKETGVKQKTDYSRTIEAEPFKFSNLAVATIVIVETIGCISPPKAHTLPLTGRS
jgi:hypothetical protein